MAVIRAVPSVRFPRLGLRPVLTVGDVGASAPIPVADYSRNTCVSSAFRFRFISMVLFMKFVLAVGSGFVLLALL
jgi:hypothetical protein